MGGVMGYVYCYVWYVIWPIYADDVILVTRNEDMLGMVVSAF